MTSIHNKLRATAADNDRLLKLISETDYAPTALKQSNSYVANLKKDILAQEKLLAETKRKIAKEEAEHKEYQTSHIKRLAYRLGGKKEKFEQKASKEEKDWVEAVQQGFECQKKLDLLNQNLAEATGNSAELDKVSATLTQAQSELDQLYKSIFEGPTPEIPGEDQRESAVYQANAVYDQAQGKWDKEKQVEHLLKEANKWLTQAGRHVEDARGNAKMDAFGFDNIFMEMAEHNSLSQVRQCVGQTDMLVSQARVLQPLIGDIGDIVHAQHDFMGDVLFDNVFSDVAKYDAIKRSQASINAAQAKLKVILAETFDRWEAAKRESIDAKKIADERRLELQKIRAEAYQNVADGSTNSGSSSSQFAAPEGPPPSYKA